MLWCEIHAGPLRQRGDGSWECAGYDGEGCGAGGPDGVGDDARARLESGRTCWPGVIAWMDKLPSSPPGTR
jgi:hypothetical protein